jgi:putative two-component system response regulator
MAKILLAEDDDTLRKLTSIILEMSGFDVFAFSNGQLALNAFSAVAPDLVVSDIGMPNLDGFGLLDGVRQIPEGAVVPFLFLSAHSEQEDINAARRLGADDFLFKPFAPDDLVDAVRSRIERRRMTEIFDTRQAHLQTIILLANVIEARDLYTRGHVERVQATALELGNALGWSKTALSALEYGALLHDIGKIIVPESILNKPSQLTREEQEIIQKHPVTGAHIIDGVSHLREARPYILFHHEKWDGTGYPSGLQGSAIPVEGRLLAIVDVYDALTSDRPYHQGIPVSDALKFLVNEAGKHFDPEMVTVFCKLHQQKSGAIFKQG